MQFEFTCSLTCISLRCAKFVLESAVTNIRRPMLQHAGPFEGVI